MRVKASRFTVAWEDIIDPRDLERHVSRALDRY